MAELSVKQEMFVRAYCGPARFNAAEAGRIAGYKQPRQMGYETLTKPYIRAEVDKYLDSVAVTAPEIIARIFDLASNAENDNDKLRALDMLAKIRGLFRERIELTWQYELNELGLPASEVFEELVAEIVGRMEVERE